MVVLLQDSLNQDIKLLHKRHCLHENSLKAIDSGVVQVVHGQLRFMLNLPELLLRHVSTEVYETSGIQEDNIISIVEGEER